MSPDVAYERAGGLTPLISRRVGQNHELLGWIAGMGDCISYGVGVRVCVFFSFCIVVESSQRCAATSFSQVGSPAELHHQIASRSLLDFFFLLLSFCPESSSRALAHL